MAISKDTTILKVYISKELRDKFKAICEADDIAMSDRVERFIARMVEKRSL